MAGTSAAVGVAADDATGVVAAVVAAAGAVVMCRGGMLSSEVTDVT